MCWVLVEELSDLKEMFTATVDETYLPKKSFQRIYDHKLLLYIKLEKGNKAI